MSLEKPKVQALVVYLPLDLAVEMYRESGNLAISDFPNILKFAECIAEVLDLERITEVGMDKLEFVVIPRSDEKKSIQRHPRKR
ncbi:MAG: hypothetical protein QXK18_04515 [Candidatus Bathyarchaeia archaeon]